MEDVVNSTGDIKRVEQGLDKEEALFTERGITNVNGTDSVTGKFNTCPEPVSYTHLTLPTNREV